MFKGEIAGQARAGAKGLAKLTSITIRPPRMVNGEALFHMQKKKLVILAAVTGGSQQDRDGAKVPCTPAEIADEALRCYKAGASVVHIHAHDEKGRKQPTGDLNVFKDIINRIRDKCDILIQTTNGIGSRRDPVTGKIIRPTEEERLGVLTIEPRQDLYSIAGGSWDFYHPGVPGKNEFSFANSTEFLRKYIPGVMATGGALEFEITEASALTKLRRLADEGVFNAQKKPPLVRLLPRLRHAALLCWTAVQTDAR